MLCRVAESGRAGAVRGQFDLSNLLSQRVTYFFSSAPTGSATPALRARIVPLAAPHLKSNIYLDNEASAGLCSESEKG